MQVRHFGARGPDFGRGPDGSLDEVGGLVAAGVDVTEITTEKRSSTVVMTARDQRRRADRRRRNVYVAARRREAVLAVATKRESSDFPRSLVTGGVVAGLVGLVAVVVLVAAPFHGSGPSATVENEIVSASRSIKTIGDSANYPTLAKAKSELATGARQFHVVSTVRNASPSSRSQSHPGTTSSSSSARRTGHVLVWPCTGSNVPAEQRSATFPLRLA